MAKAHICIGGPLDGEFATSDDFYGGYEKKNGRNDYSAPYSGMYEHLDGQYFQFNTASHGRAPTDVVWLYKDIMKPSISPSKR